MKKRLNGRETLLIATMLFGMFFGAGNLIFPVYMGQLAGRNIWKAIAGFIITGVSMPLLGVAAIGVSRSNGLFELSSKVSRPYGYFFTCALYLSIGPFFAIPRCATVPFTVAVSGLLPAEEQGLALAFFSLIFFALVLGFSLNPGKILTYVGKVLTHSYITDSIWGNHVDNDVASLRVFMATLRKKIERDPNSPQYIQTHIGVGYRMLRVE